MKQTTRGADKPFVVVMVQLHELCVFEAGEVCLSWLIRCGVFNPVDASISAVPAFRVRVMAMLLVIPVNHVHRAVRAVLKIDCDISRVAAKEHVLAGVDGVEAGTEPMIDLLIDLVAVEVVSEEVPAEFG